MDGPILLKYQSDALADRSPVVVIEKSRRIGASYAEAAGAVLNSSVRGGANTYYISFSREMTAGFIGDCAQWAKIFGAGASKIRESIFTDPVNPEKSIIKYSIKFNSGREIQALSSAPRSLRSKGRPGEMLIIDEAAFVDDFDELLKAALAMTMWGGRVRILSTHNGEENPFNALINDIRAGRRDYSLRRISLDDALADGLFKRICAIGKREWTPDEENAWRSSLVARYRPNSDEELFCIPTFGGGAYLPRALIESCMVPAPLIRFSGSRAFNESSEPSRRAEMQDWIEEQVKPLLKNLDVERRHALGMDFARSGDMSNIAPIEVGETLHRRVPFLIEMHNVPHKQQEQVLFSVCDGLPRFFAASIDAGGNGSYIAEAARDRYGSIIEELKFTEGWYRDNMPKYKASFEDRLISIPMHDDVLEDHRAIKIVRGIPRIPPGNTDKKGERHGDSAIGITMAYTASFRDGGPVRVGVGRSRAASSWMAGYA